MNGNHITEILPDLDKMPAWAREAFEDGQFFDVAFKRVERLELTIDRCAIYLKEDEEPDQCIARNRRDVTNSIKQVAREMKRAEKAEATLDAVGRWLEVSCNQQMFEPMKLEAILEGRS